MGIIYKIWNERNEKVYIGQTTQSLSQRWVNHKYACNSNKSGHLYAAMRLYGEKYFHIEQIEECANEKLDERERFWISYYNSYHNGYNMTLGGQNYKPLLTDDEIKTIYNLWDNGMSVKDIERKTGFSRTQIRDRLRGYPTYTTEEIAIRGNSSRSASKNKKISQWNLKGEFIGSYESARKAEEITGISYKNISSVVTNKTKTAGSFYWTLGEEKPILAKKTSSQVKVGQYDKDGVLLNTFKSYAEASRITGINDRCIGDACRGRQKTAGGFIWKRIE